MGNIVLNQNSRQRPQTCCCCCDARSPFAFKSIMCRLAWISGVRTSKSSVYSPISQPFSACNSRRGTFLIFVAFFAFFMTVFFSFFPVFSLHVRNYAVVEYLVYSSTANTAQHSTAPHRTAQHNTAQRNQPCTKQQTKNVPIRVHIKRIRVHACGVRVVFLEHGALGITQIACLHLKCWTIYYTW